MIEQFLLWTFTLSPMTVFSVIIFYFVLVELGWAKWKRDYVKSMDTNARFVEVDDITTPDRY